MTSQTRLEASARRPTRHESQPSSQNSEASAEVSFENNERIQSIILNSGFHVLKRNALATNCQAHPSEQAAYYRTENSRLVCGKCVFLYEMLNFLPNKHPFNDEEKAKIVKVNNLYSSFVDFSAYCEGVVVRRPVFSDTFIEGAKKALAAHFARIERAVIGEVERLQLGQVADDLKRELSQFKKDISVNYAKILFRMEMKAFDEIIDSYHKKLDELRDELELQAKNVPKSLRSTQAKEHFAERLDRAVGKTIDRLIRQGVNKWDIQQPFSFRHKKAPRRGCTIERVLTLQLPSSGARASSDSDANRPRRSDHGHPKTDNLTLILQKSQRFSEYFKETKKDRKTDSLKNGPKIEITARPITPETLAQFQAPSLVINPNTITTPPPPAPQVPPAKSNKVPPPPDMPPFPDPPSKGIFQQEFNESSVHSKPSVLDSASIKNRSSMKDYNSFSPSSNITFQKGGDFVKNSSVISVSDLGEPFASKFAATFEARPDSHMTPDFGAFKTAPKSAFVAFDTARDHPTPYPVQPKQDIFIPHPPTATESDPPGEPEQHTPKVRTSPRGMEQRLPCSNDRDDSPLKTPSLDAPTLSSKKPSDAKQKSPCNILLNVDSKLSQNSNRSSSHLPAPKRTIFDHPVRLPVSIQASCRDLMGSLKLGSETHVLHGLQSLVTNNSDRLQADSSDMKQKMKNMKQVTNDLLAKIQLNIPKPRKNLDKIIDAPKWATMKINAALQEDQTIKKETEKAIDAVHSLLSKQPSKFMTQSYLPGSLSGSGGVSVGGSAGGNSAGKNSARGRKEGDLRLKNAVSLQTEDFGSAKVATMETPKVEHLETRKTTSAAKDSGLKGLLRSRLKPSMAQLRKINLQSASGRVDIHNQPELRSPKNKNGRKSKDDIKSDLMERLLSKH